MSFATVVVPAAPVRKKPRHQSEMTNQLLFGESVQILKEKRGFWVKVRSLHDKYEGWMTRNLLLDVDETAARTEARHIASDNINKLVFGDQLMYVPRGAHILNFNEGSGRIGEKSFDFNGNFIDRLAGGMNADKLEELAKNWLNAPYCWVGRTILGVDCSGFAQVNFKLLGIDLPRDAWQQAQEGHAIKKLKDAQKGDLAFFDDRDEIVHVGILLSSDSIIHASGRVKIDSIDKKGIINSDTGKRTHSLRAIRRFF